MLQRDPQRQLGSKMYERTHFRPVLVYPAVGQRVSWGKEGWPQEALPCHASCPQLQELHRAGGDLMHRDERSRTLLHHAVSTGSKDVVRYLLDHGEPGDGAQGLGPRWEEEGLSGLSDHPLPFSSPPRDPRCRGGKVSIWAVQDPGHPRNRPFPHPSHFVRSEPINFLATSVIPWATPVAPEPRTSCLF